MDPPKFSVYLIYICQIHLPAVFVFKRMQNVYPVRQCQTIKSIEINCIGSLGMENAIENILPFVCFAIDTSYTV